MTCPSDTKALFELAWELALALGSALAWELALALGSALAWELVQPH
jgi:hypothetical protein